jgi:hypothetical protein
MVGSLVLFLFSNFSLVYHEKVKEKYKPIYIEILIKKEEKALKMRERDKHTLIYLRHIYQYILQSFK